MESRNQISNVTHYNRYPEIFKAVVNIKKDHKDLSILSFGCSTGEEVRTLREMYFPQSHITGVDINTEIIYTNRLENKDENINYLIPMELKAKQLLFNVIFCMSVLCLYGKGTNLNEYEFSKFESTIMDIHSMLSVGGILVIRNSSYFFEDTKVYENYKKIPVENILSGFIPKYKKDGTLYTEKDPLFLYLRVK